MEIKLRTQIETINIQFDKQEDDLKKMRTKAINEAWDYQIESGMLKQDLDNPTT